MASVNISYIREPELPANVRQQVESLSQQRIALGARVCIAMLGEHLLGACSIRPSGSFARIDHLIIGDAHTKTRLAEILLLHSLKQLHKIGVREVNVAVPEPQLDTFLDAGFMEETITIPGMHEKPTLIELVHPDISELEAQFGEMQDRSARSALPEQQSVVNSDNRSIRFDTMSSYKDLGRMVICNAKRRVYILCESLEDPLLTDREIASHIQDMVLHSNHVEIRILLENDRQSSNSYNHSPIVDLAQRLSSFVSIRKIHDKRIAPKAWLYLCDDIHAIERRREHGFKGEAHIESPMTLQRLSYQFENLWQHSIPSSELRRLAI